MDRQRDTQPEMDKQIEVHTDIHTARWIHRQRDRHTHIQIVGGISYLSGSSEFLNELALPPLWTMVLPLNSSRK